MDDGGAQVAAAMQRLVALVPQMGALRISDNPDCGPGALNGGGPRHDNDKEDIREISVVPTPQELLCPLTPYLPHNKGGGSPHMVKGTPEALADLHFRLLRHDLVQPLCTSVQAFARNEVMSGRQPSARLAGLHLPRHAAPLTAPRSPTQR